MAAPNTTTWLPKLREGRDGYSQMVRLINQLRDRIMGGSGGVPGLALFSTALGRGDSTTTTSGNEDTFILEWQLPDVYPSFQFSLGGMLLSAAGSPIVRVRLGGTWGAFDGTVIATINPAVAPLVLTNVSTDGNLVTGNTATIIKITLQAASAGHKATWVGGFAIGR